MARYSRSFRLAIAVVSLAAIRWVAVSGVPGTFTPFVPRALPQSAQGDFDGDGRPDLALIQDGDGGRQVLVRLSGSLDVASLGTSVVSLVVSDIDHDGDLDLVGITSLNQVVTWLNDGRGRFTPQPIAHSRTLSADPTFANPPPDALLAVAGTVPCVVPRTLYGTAVGVAWSRAPTLPPAFDLRVRPLPRLRAPPAPRLT
jgi:hypothetical protein